MKWNYTEILLPFTVEHLIFTIRIFNFDKVSSAPVKNWHPRLRVTRAQTIIAWKKKSAPTVKGNTGTNTGTNYKPMP